MDPWQAYNHHLEPAPNASQTFQAFESRGLGEQSFNAEEPVLEVSTFPPRPPSGPEERSFNAESLQPMNAEEHVLEVNTSPPQPSSGPNIRHSYGVDNALPSFDTNVDLSLIPKSWAALGHKQPTPSE
ncbi:MAG: hypothetical protein Q9160_008630 [Pyrenula sp. 1 TL-2023]